MEPREAAARILRAHLKLIVGLTLAGAVVAFALHLDDRELFTAGARITLDTADPTSAAEAQAISDTARAIATSSGVVAEALARAGVDDLTTADVDRFAAEDVHVQGLGSSGVMELSVTYPDDRMAAEIANQLADGVVKTRLRATRGRLSQIVAALDGQLLEIDRELGHLRFSDKPLASTRSRIAHLNRERSDLASERASITLQDSLRPQPSIVDPAHAPVAPDPLRLPQDIALGALLGLVLGIGIAACIETMTPTLVGTDAIAREVGAPVLAELPRSNGHSTAFQRELADNRVRLAAGFARMGAFELADLGPVTMSPDIELLASRLSDPIRGDRVRVTGGEHLEVSSVADGDAATNGGLVVVAPTVMKKHDMQWVTSSLHAGRLKVFGVVTYPPTRPWRSAGHRRSRALNSRVIKPHEQEEKRDERRHT